MTTETCPKCHHPKAGHNEAIGCTSWDCACLRGSWLRIVLLVAAGLLAIACIVAAL